MKNYGENTTFALIGYFVNNNNFTTILKLFTNQSLQRP